MRRNSLGFTRVVLPLVLMIVTAVVAVAAVAVVRERAGHGGEGGGEGSGKGGSTVQSVHTSATALLGTAHRDSDQAVQAWQDLAATVVSALETGDSAAASEELNRALATAVSTAAGRDALDATEAALDGQILTLPDTSRAAAASRAARAVRSQRTAPELRAYFVNGSFDDIVSATYLAAELGALYRTPVRLVYNRSFARTEGYAVQLCLRGIVARYPDPAAMDGVTLAAVIERVEADESGTTGDAVLAAACRAVQDGLREAGGAAGPLKQFLAASIEVAKTWLNTAGSRSVPAVPNLVRRLKDDLLAGDPAVLTSHGQGTMFARRAFEDFTDWYLTAHASGELAGCWPALPPMGSLYVSPAFGTDWFERTPAFTQDARGFGDQRGIDLPRDLQRYVALHGDLMGQVKTGWVQPTAEPTEPQKGAIPAFRPVRLHLLQTYLMSPDESSESRRQIRDRFGELRETVSGMARDMSPNLGPDASCRGGALRHRTSTPDPDPGSSGSEDVPSPSTFDSEESGNDSNNDPSTESDGSEGSDDGPWVVWHAEKPYEGIGINVTTKRTFETEELASGYSGGGLSATATFTKKRLIGTDFPTEEAATAAVCAGLTEVRMWPLGAGMHGKWTDGVYYALGNGVSCPTS